MKRITKFIKLVTILLIVVSVILAYMDCIRHVAHPLGEPRGSTLGYKEYNDMTFPGIVIISTLQVLLMLGGSRLIYAVNLLLAFIRMLIHCLSIPFRELFESYGGLYTHSYNFTICGYCVKYLSIFIMLLSVVLLILCFRENKIKNKNKNEGSGEQMKKLMMKIYLHIKTKLIFTLIWTLWLALALSECYIITNARSHEIVEINGFVTWTTVLVLLVEVIFLFANRYLYFPIATIFFHLHAVLPLIEMFVLDKISEFYSSIVYIREPDGGRVTYYLMEITTIGYVCIALSFVLMLLHFCLSVKMYKK